MVNHNLVGGFNLPLWKMMEWVRVGMMIFPIWWESHSKFHGSKPPTRSMIPEIDTTKIHLKQSPACFTRFHVWLLDPLLPSMPGFCGTAMVRVVPPLGLSGLVATRPSIHPARPWAPDPSGPCSRPWEVTLVQEVPGLVNIEKTMEKRYFSWVNQLFRLGHFQ